MYANIKSWLAAPMKLSEYVPRLETDRQKPQTSKNIVSLVHRGACCAWVVHIAPSWCTSTPFTVVVVYNVPWVHPEGRTDGQILPSTSSPSFALDKYMTGKVGPMEPPRMENCMHYHCSKNQSNVTPFLMKFWLGCVSWTAGLVHDNQKSQSIWTSI